MLNKLNTFFRAQRSVFYTVVARLIYSGKNVSIGKKVVFATYPRMVLKKNSNLKIGDNVVIGSNADIRVYENSFLIIEDNCKIDSGVRIIAANGKTVHLESNTKIGFYSVVNGGGGVHIGKNCSTYGFVYIQSSFHEVKTSFSKTDYLHSEVLIEDSVLIGPHSVIQPGSHILKNTILPAFSNIEKN